MQIVRATKDALGYHLTVKNDPGNPDEADKTFDFGLTPPEGMDDADYESQMLTEIKAQLIPAAQEAARLEYEGVSLDDALTAAKAKQKPKAK